MSSFLGSKCKVYDIFMLIQSQCWISYKSTIQGKAIFRHNPRLTNSQIKTKVKTSEFRQHFSSSFFLRLKSVKFVLVIKHLFDLKCSRKKNNRISTPSFWLKNRCFVHIFWLKKYGFLLTFRQNYSQIIFLVWLQVCYESLETLKVDIFRWT